MPSSPNEVDLTETQRNHSQSRLIGMAVTGSVNNAFITSISSLFLLALGATPFQMGLLASTTNLQRATRLIGIHLIPRIGKAGLMYWGRVSSLIPTVGLILIALWFANGSTAIWLAIGLLTVRGLLQQTGNTSWWPLVQDNTTEDALGRFLAKMRMAQRATELILPVFVGIYLGAKPPAHQFALLFGITLAATLLGAWWVRQVAEHPTPNTSENLWQRLWQTLKHKPIRQMGVYMAGYMGLRALGYTFWVVVLTDRGMPYMYFVWMTSVMAFGQLISLPIWGKLVDRHGGRPILSMALTGMAALGLAWYHLPPQTAWLLPWVGGIFLLWGILDGGHQIGRTHTMMGAVSRDYQAEGFSMIMYGASFGGIIGGIAGGAIFQWIETVHLSGWDLPLCYLAAAQFLYLGIWLLSTRLPGHREQPTVFALFKKMRHTT